MLQEGGAISSETWDTLSSRVANELSPEEVATLDTTIHIYFKKERAAEYNHRRLAELDSPSCGSSLSMKVQGPHRLLQMMLRTSSLLCTSVKVPG